MGKGSMRNSSSPSRSCPLHAFVMCMALQSSPGPLVFPSQFCIGSSAQDQYGGRVAFFLRHDIQAVIHAVNQVHVCMARRPEHDFRSRCSSLRRVCGKIVFSQIRLRLHDPSAAFDFSVAMHEMHAKYFLRYADGVAVVEGAWKFLHGSISEQDRVIVERAPYAFKNILLSAVSMPVGEESASLCLG